MVADDDVHVAETIATSLAATSYEVVVEQSAKRALGRAEQEKPNVCLLDIDLPEMSGIELAKQIRKIPGMVEAVLITVTGYEQDDDRVKTRNAGFEHHFVKLIDTSELISVLAGYKYKIADR